MNDPKRAQVEADEPGPGWVPFDEQRRLSDFRRADIVFGPDMFDPRTDNGDRPLTEAMRKGRSKVKPENLSKTVGEVFGLKLKPGEIRATLLENARSIRTDSED